MEGGKAMTKKRILIVDDDVATCETLSDLFEVEGYLTQVAYTGREAVESVERHRFDVVLLDVRMSRMDGVNVLRRMSRVFPPIKVLMITAHSESGLLQDVDDLGAAGFHPKPLDMRKLIIAVDDACRDTEKNIALNTGPRDAESRGSGTL